MIQRFQTLLLAMALTLAVLMCFLNMAVVPGAANPEEASLLFWDYKPFRLFLIVIPLLHLFAISFYKARTIQIRLCIINLVLLFGFQTWLVVNWFKFHTEMRFCLPGIFPLIQIILTFMAIRYIFRDELMVRSYDRMRTPRAARKRH